MKNFINSNFTGFIILGFLIWFFLIKHNENPEVVKLQNQNTRLELKIDALKIIMQNRFDSINVIEQHKTFITNKYLNESKQIDTTNNRDTLRNIIREQMHRLGSPRFDLLSTGAATKR